MEALENNVHDKSTGCFVWHIAPRHRSTCSDSYMAMCVQHD